MALDTLPSLRCVKDLLQGLLGRDLTVKQDDTWSPGPSDALVAAGFEDDEGTLSAFVVVDLPLGIFRGAAVGLVPAGGAKDMIRAGQLEAMISENLNEVLNVVSSSFNEANASHVRLATMHLPAPSVAPLVAGWVAGSPGHLGLTVDVAGYGGGRMLLGRAGI